MAGCGTGYPSFHECSVARRYYSRDVGEQARYRAGHVVTLTGSMRPTRRTGKGHQRKSWMTFQWACSCGASGWSSHVDLERRAIREGLIAADDPRLHWQLTTRRA